MKQGDVFKVEKDDQMLYAESVAPSGTVYARKFDVYKGTYGDPVSIKQTAEIEVLFNVFEPEKLDDWEYCEIKIVEEKDGMAYCDWFEVFVEAENGVRSLGKSEKRCYGEPILYFKDEYNEKIHQSFLGKLLKQGWEVVLERHHSWYGLRLKRKKNYKSKNFINWLK